MHAQTLTASVMAISIWVYFAPAEDADALDAALGPTIASCSLQAYWPGCDSRRAS